MRSCLPKVLHDLAGKPLLAHVLDTARALNPRKIHVVIGYEADRVRSVFSSEKDLSWVEQKQQRGTGHAVKQVLPHIGDDALVLVLFGDNPLVQQNTLDKVISTLGQPETKNAPDIVLVTAEVAEPAGLGRILRDPAGKLAAIVEDKDASPDQLAIREINTGIMAASKTLLQPYLDQLEPDNAQNELYLTDIVALAAKSGTDIAVCNTEKEYEALGINDRAQLAEVERVYQNLEAQRLMLGGVTLRDPSRLDIRGDVDVGMDSILDANIVLEGRVKLGERVHVSSGVCIRDSIIEDDVVIHPNTVIEGAMIGKRCELGPFARLRPGSELEESVKLGNFVETKKSHIARGTKASHLSYLGDSDIGERSNIGAGTIVCNYDGIDKHQTVIGDDVFVGSNATLIAPLKIGDGGFIAAGSTISVEVAKEELAIGRGKQRNITGWTPPAKRKPKINRES